MVRTCRTVRNESLNELCSGRARRLRTAQVELSTCVSPINSQVAQPAGLLSVTRDFTTKYSPIDAFMSLSRQGTRSHLRRESESHWVLSTARIEATV